MIVQTIDDTLCFAQLDLSTIPQFLAEPLQSGCSYMTAAVLVTRDQFPAASGQESTVHRNVDSTLGSLQLGSQSQGQRRPSQGILEHFH